jgi:hypothetical protein
LLDNAGENNQAKAQDESSIESVDQINDNSDKGNEDEEQEIEEDPPTQVKDSKYCVIPQDRV